MGRLVIPNVEEIDGRLYFRRRFTSGDGRRKVQRIRLPSADSPDFPAALARAKAGTTVERPQVAPGSIAALAHIFRAQIGKRKLAASTRANYLVYVGRIEADHGHRSVKGMRPAHVYRIRDAMEETPGVAYNYLAVLRQMMEFACERDWRGDNPAARVPALPLGEHEPWPVDVIEAALRTAPPMMRLAIITGLCGGQRISDCIRMQHAWHDRRMMELVQQKTGVAVAIPMHPLWLAEIDRMPRRALTILYDRSGEPFNGPSPIQERLRTLMGKIGAEGFTFHGLRKNACCYLLEMGLNDVQVGALLGMSPEIVRHYGKRSRALMIAREVAGQVTGATLHVIGGPRSERGTG